MRKIADISIPIIWNHWLTQRRRWLPTVVFIPSLYLVGWVVVQFIAIAFRQSIHQKDLSLASTLVTFLLFIALLPGWSRARWKDDHIFKTIGLVDFSKRRSFRFLFRGLFFSFGLTGFVLIPLLLTPWCNWLGFFNSGIAFNAFFLGLGVGFAEELIFRGWLLTEMKYMFGKNIGLFVQAVIFSLAHFRLNSNFFSTFGLLLGLFLLAILLGLITNKESSSLWGCIGLHGGLVGGWFFISNGVVEFSSQTPGWLFGAGGSNLNPIGGLLSIVALTLIIYSQRTAFAMAAPPVKGACKASSRGDSP